MTAEITHEFVGMIPIMGEREEADAVQIAVTIPEPTIVGDQIATPDPVQIEVDIPNVGGAVQLETESSLLQENDDTLLTESDVSAKITEFTDDDPLDPDTDYLPTVQGVGATPVDTTMKVSWNQIWDLVDREYLHHRPSPNANDDEFDDESLHTDWTVVEDTSPNISVYEKGGRLIVHHPGGDASAEMHGIVKPISPAGSFRIESAARLQGNISDYMYIGLCASDGATWGSSSAQMWQGIAPTYVSSPRTQSIVRRMSDWDTSQADGTVADYSRTGGLIYLSLEYDSGTGVWTSTQGPDPEAGAHLYKSTLTHSMSATHLGFAISNWNNGTSDIQVAFEYFRYDDL